MKRSVKVLVATHKKYWMPKDEMYIPIHVGAYGKNLELGYIKDDTGDNISIKNRNYCELTGLYWAWKNLDADYIGLVHYRRHFAIDKRGDKKNRVLKTSQLLNILKRYDVVLPKKRNYFIETNYSQYIHAHNAIDLIKTREIIQEKFPMYIENYDKIMKRTNGHRFNMFVMEKNLLNEYCTWLFDILFELEKRIDISKYTQNDARVFGFVSERLLDVWIITNKIEFKEVPYIFMENQNWIIKGYSFLKRKFVKKNEKKI